MGAKSAGRVQSAALRMLCEREAAVESFLPRKYYSVEAQLGLPGGEAAPILGSPLPDSRNNR